MMDVLMNNGLATPLMKDRKEGAYNDDQWEELNTRARATIWLHLGESIFFTIMDNTTAFKLWDSLCSASWDGKSASNKLTSKGLNFNDEMKTIFLLCSLPASWDTFNTAISNSAHGGKLAFGDVTSVLLTEEIRCWLQYAYNNTVHSSTGKAPFEIVEGGKKVPPILHTKDKIFEADKYVQDMDEMYKKVKVALEKTQAKQKKATDSHRREVVFSLGDWVLLRFEKARLKKMKGKERLFPKLSMRYYGPFQVCDKISDVSYRLKFSESWRIHNAFHVSLLRPYVGDVPEDLPVEDQPEVEELDEILAPEQILAHKERKVKGKVARRYLVKFRNYPPMDAKWMEEGELAESPTVLSLYLEAFGLQPT
ncbi:hypothetical protein L7F22_014061 [Adiantum nelumboides]|nr:hypothetical protein [Adiantum nelumboides]